MRHYLRPWQSFHSVLLALAAVSSMLSTSTLSAAKDDQWFALFDGKSLKGWSEHGEGGVWRVEDGCLVASGRGGNLIYDGEAADRAFRNFELEAEVLTQGGCDSGIFFGADCRDLGRPASGYQLQIHNACPAAGGACSKAKTGSVYGLRNLYRATARDGEWFRVRLRIAGDRICTWVNGYPAVDLLLSSQSDRGDRDRRRPSSHESIALEGSIDGGRIAFRRIAVRPLPDAAGAEFPGRELDAGYGLENSLMERCSRAFIPVIDYHVHLRGGMTVEKAIKRQAVCGINIGVLRNLGKGWPIENDGQLREFLDSVAGRPVFVGLQVNDRDWMDKHSPDLLAKLDFVLADTMIMPMPRDDSEPVKLWITEGYRIEDPEAWMQRYMRHNLRVLSEPITILANPTYLPPGVQDRYDELWTDARMRQVVEAAIANDVALEINARSGLPHDRFIRLAKKLGAKFTFGSNNFDDQPIDMARCFEVIDRHGLSGDDMYLPRAKTPRANGSAPAKGAKKHPPAMMSN